MLDHLCSQHYILYVWVSTLIVMEKTKEVMHLITHFFSSWKEVGYLRTIVYIIHSFFFFNVDHFFLSVYWICYNIASFLYVLVVWSWGMWDLSSLTRDRTLSPCVGRQSLNPWTTREVPYTFFSKKHNRKFFPLFCFLLLLPPVEFRCFTCINSRSDVGWSNCIYKMPLESKD